MRRTIVVEVEDTDGLLENDRLIERGVDVALSSFFGIIGAITVINVEAADGTPAEAFGIGKEKP